MRGLHPPDFGTLVQVGDPEGRGDVRRGCPGPTGRQADGADSRAFRRAGTLELLREEAPQEFAEPPVDGGFVVFASESLYGEGPDLAGELLS